MILTPPADLTYNGSAKAVAISGSFTNGMQTPAAVIYRKDGAALDGVPTNAGTYTASITVNGVTAALTYNLLLKFHADVGNDAV